MLMNIIYIKIFPCLLPGKQGADNLLFTGKLSK